MFIFFSFFFFRWFDITSKICGRLFFIKSTSCDPVCPFLFHLFFLVHYTYPHLHVQYEYYFNIYTCSTNTISTSTRSVRILFPHLHIQYEYYTHIYMFSTNTISTSTHSVRILFPHLHVQYEYYTHIYTFSTNTISTSTRAVRILFPHLHVPRKCSSKDIRDFRYIAPISSVRSTLGCIILY